MNKCPPFFVLEVCTMSVEITDVEYQERIV